MTALIALAITLFLGLVLYLANNLVLSFNERCQQKFYTRLLTFKSFIFTCLSLFIIAFGADIAFLVDTAHRALLSGILLTILGCVALILLAWDNVQKTSALFAVIGTLSLLFFSLLTYALIVSIFTFGIFCGLNHIFTPL